LCPRRTAPARPSPGRVVPARQEAGGMSLDAAIMAQLQNAKANMGPGNPMMAGALAARPGQPTPGLPVMPPGFPMGVAPQQSPAPPPGANLLSVAVNGLPFRYQLNEADLREMCQRWGPLQNVVIYRDGQREVGVIVFGDAVDTADCARQLSGYACTFDSPGGPASGSLAVVIGGPEQLAGPRQGQPGAVPMGAPGPMGGAPQMAPMGGQPPQPQMMGQPGMEMQGAIPKSAPEMMKGKGNGKGHPGWSAKVVIQAERLHPDFPTITKVCGPGGQNMEHIRSQGNCSVELRGKNSGTIDPRTGQELQENLYLLLGSDSNENGLATLEMVKDLLGSVYDEHQQWCMQHKLQWPEGLQPQVVENPHLMEGF